MISEISPFHLPNKQTVMQDKEIQLKKMLDTNKVQKDFYEYDPTEQEDFEYDGNIIGRTWAKFRSNYGTIVNTLGEFEMWIAM